MLLSCRCLPQELTLLPWPKRQRHSRPHQMRNQLHLSAHGQQRFFTFIIGMSRDPTNNIGFQGPTSRSDINWAVLLTDSVNKCLYVVKHEAFQLCDVAPAEQLAENSSALRVLLRVPSTNQLRVVDR